MILYLVSNGADDQGDSLNKYGVVYRMLSYCYIKGKRAGFLRDYVTRGHGRYIDEEAEAIRKMSPREFFDFLSKINPKEVEND